MTLTTGEAIAKSIFGSRDGGPDTLVDAVDTINKSLRRIASGGIDGPDGLELVAMALSRDDDYSVSEALLRIAGSNHEIAESIDALARAVEKSV